VPLWLERRLHPNEHSLVAFLTSGLDLGRHARVQAHLEICLRCRSELAALDQLLQSCDALREEAPPALLEKTREELAAFLPDTVASTPPSGWRRAIQVEVAALVGARGAASCASPSVCEPSLALASVSPVLSSLLGRRTVSSLLPPSAANPEPTITQ